MTLNKNRLENNKNRLVGEEVGRHFKYSVLILIILISPFSSWAKTTEALPVIVLNDTNKKPFTTENKDGFLNVLLVEAFKRVGYALKMVKLPAERGLISADEGIVDGEVNRIGGIEKKYKNLLSVPERLRDSDFCALSKNPNMVNNPEVLSQYVVGYIKGWKIYERMMANSANIIVANDANQLYRLLKIDRIDVVLYTCLQSKVLTTELGIEGVSVLKPLFKQRGMFLYLNKKHQLLVPKLTQALKDIKQEGLYDKWYKEKILSYYKKFEE